MTQICCGALWNERVPKKFVDLETEFLIILVLF